MPSGLRAERRRYAASCCTTSALTRLPVRRSRRTYFGATSFICCPQHFSECSISGGHGHAFS